MEHPVTKVVTDTGAAQGTLSTIFSPSRDWPGTAGQDCPEGCPAYKLHPDGHVHIHVCVAPKT